MRAEYFAILQQSGHRRVYSSLRAATDAWSGLSEAWVENHKAILAGPFLSREAALAASWAEWVSGGSQAGRPKEVSRG